MSLVICLARLLPNDITRFPPPCICCMKNRIKPTINSSGNTCIRIARMLVDVCGFTVIAIPLSTSSCAMS